MKQPSREGRLNPAAFVIAAGLAAMAAVLLWDASGITQDGGYAGIGPADVPRMIAFCLIGLAVWTVIAGLRRDVPEPPRQEAAPVIWILLGLGLQLAFLHVLGFVITGALLFACTARGFGQRNLPLGFGIGLGLAVLTYGVFDRLLRLNLPGGPLEMALFGG